MIAASTRRLVGRMFDCRSLATDEVKGLPQPVEAWQVLGETAGVSRFEARRAGALSPLVGRQEEIELLLRRWEQAKRGEGRVVLLSGEPGIGKSRIAESLLAGSRASRRRAFAISARLTIRTARSIRSSRSSSGPRASSPAATPARSSTGWRPCSSRRRGMCHGIVALIAELLSVPTDGRYPALAVSPQQKRS